MKQKAIHSYKIAFSGEKATSFGGLVLSERLASRHGLWSVVQEFLPQRLGFDWLDILKTSTAGLLTGARGTYAAEDVRRDEALLEGNAFETSRV